jgi:hypothetical protein
VLRVNFAQPQKIKGGQLGWSHQPGTCPMWLRSSVRGGVGSDTCVGGLSATGGRATAVWADTDAYMDTTAAEEEQRVRSRWPARLTDGHARVRVFAVAAAASVC